MIYYFFLVQAETDLQKATADANIGSEALKRQILLFEKQKLTDLKVSNLISSLVHNSRCLGSEIHGRWNSAHDSMASHCIKPFITPISLSCYDLNTVERDVKHKILLIITAAIRGLWQFTCIGMGKSQGPAVQSILSLTSSLKVISLTVLADSIHNFLIFFAEKM